MPEESIAVQRYKMKRAERVIDKYLKGREPELKHFAKELLSQNAKKSNYNLSKMAVNKFLKANGFDGNNQYVRFNGVIPAIQYLLYLRSNGTKCRIVKVDGFYEIRMDDGNTELVYGLCKGEGIDTKGMSPAEAWKALEEKTGRTAKEEYKKLENKGTSDGSIEFGKETRTAERISEAKERFNNMLPADVHKELFTVAQKAWNNASVKEKQTAIAYTYNSTPFNEPLRNGIENISKQEADDVNSLTHLIDKSESPRDITVARGISVDSVLKMLKNSTRGAFYKADFLKNDKEYDLHKIADYINKEESHTKDDAFMSCGAVNGKGSVYKGVQLNIYCPKGTKMLYCEPFSALGANAIATGEKTVWNGESDYNSKNNAYSQEQEVLLQRGTKLAFTKAEVKKEEIISPFSFETLVVECYVESQPKQKDIRHRRL